MFEFYKVNLSKIKVRELERSMSIVYFRAKYARTVQRARVIDEHGLHMRGFKILHCIQRRSCWCCTD